MKIIKAIKDREPVLTVGLLEAAVGVAGFISLQAGVSAEAVAGGVSSLNVLIGAFVAWVVRSRTTTPANVHDWLTAEAARKDA